MSKQFLAVFSAALLLAGAVHAADYRAGDIKITDPYARPTVPGQPGAAAYLTLENSGAADRLVGVASPAAQSTEIHVMRMDGDIMRMREAGELPLAPAAKVTMRPGTGYHIMLNGLKQPLQQGASFPMTLTFEKAGKVEVTVVVDGRQAKSAGHGH